MKKLIPFFLLAFIAVSCSDNSVELPEDIQELQSMRDSVKAKKDSLNTVLAEIELQLAELDTTKKLQLVTIMEAPLKKFEHFFTVHGVIQTDNMAMVNAETQGKITSLRVAEGSRISAGQTIAVLSSDIIRKNIQEVETQLDLAQTVFERQEKLWKQNVGSEIQYLEAKTNRDALKNKLQTLQEQLALTVVKAPFSGIVDEVFPKEGELTGPGAPIIRLINLDEVYIKADVSETYLNKINEGDSVSVVLPNMVDRKLTSSISRIGDFINPDNRTFKIRVDIKNQEGLLKPNMLAEIKIRDYANDSTVVIPENLILRGAKDRKYVFVAELTGDQVATVTKKQLNTGFSYEQQTEILAGIEAGAYVINKGARSIQEGEIVEISK